jgi:uncharacterized integral membrane protein (TIGR00698 family)
MPRKKFKELVRTDWAGLVLAILVGLVAYWVASYDQAIDSLVVGLILGMIIRTIMGDRPLFLPGFDLAPKIFIPFGVIFYGINLKFNRLVEIPAIIWLQLVIAIVAIFAVAIYLGRFLKIRDRNSLLIATGTAICGASAIAITTPVVKADSEEASTSLIVITIFGLIGLLVYPLVTIYFAFTTTQYAALCATTLHMTGIVKAAALALGEGCVKLALSIKMARTALIIPIIGFLYWYRERGREIRKKKNVLLRIPWFMWVFVLVGLLTSFVPGLSPVLLALKPWAGIFFTMALTSIGLSVNLRKMLNVGGSPLIVGLVCWLIGIAIFILISYSYA